MGKNQSLLLLLNVISEEVTCTNFIIFGLTQPGLKVMKSCTQGELKVNMSTITPPMWFTK